MKTLFLIFGLLVSTTLFPHRGIVVDENGEGVPFCKITAPSLGITTYTDFDGVYVIEVPDGTELLIEYISYDTQVVYSKDSMIIGLQEHLPPSIQ